jgi:hypothetical protein
MTSSVRLARTAGLYYLVVAICSGFAEIVRQNVYVPGDAVASAQNVVASADLVRLSFVADLVQATFAVFVVLALYRLLQHVHQGLARAMVVFVVIQVAITSLNMVHQLGALVVATNPSYASSFGPGGSDALVLLLLDLQHNGFLVAQIFFGLWLFPLGLLAYHSGMFPRPLGVLLMVATGAYLVDVAMKFLAADVADAVSQVVLVPIVVVAEVSMLVYLLVKGVRTPARASSPTSADRVLVSH